MADFEPYQPIYVPSKEEADRSLAALDGEFDSGRYWTVLHTADPKVNRIFELAKHYFTIEKQVLLRHSEFTWFRVKMRMGYAGPVGEMLASAAHWYGATENTTPENTTPELLDEEKDPIIDPIADVVEEKVTDAKKVFDQIGKGVGAVAGLAIVRMLIYGLIQLARNTKESS